MPLSWNEIKHRAITFSREWKTAASEKPERQTFWNELFEVFGVRRRTVASFEEPVKKLSGNWGYFDLFSPGKVLVGPFPHDRARVEHLFALYEQLTAPLAPAAKPKRARRSDPV